MPAILPPAGGAPGLIDDPGKRAGTVVRSADYWLSPQLDQAGDFRAAAVANRRAGLDAAGPPGTPAGEPLRVAAPSGSGPVPPGAAAVTQQRRRAPGQRSRRGRDA